MPYVTNFLFKHIDNTKEKKTNASILQVIGLKSFPAKYSFGLQFQLVFENPYEQHVGHLEFYRPDGSLLTETSSFVVKASERPSMPEEIDDYELLTGVAYQLAFNDIVFERPGLYILKIICDGSETAQFAITVANDES